MRLGVDLRCLPLDGSAGAGVAHAARGLWRAICAIADRETLDVVAFVPKGAAPSLSSLSYSREMKGGVVFLADASGGSLRRAVRSHPVDALFFPGGAVPPRISVPTFPWVHDVAIFEHPEWFPQSWWKRQVTTRLFLRGLHRARHIFTVSSHTKTEVVRIAGIDPSRITVTMEGVQVDFATHENTISPLQKPYALILGTVEPRKNIPFIAEWWPEVRRRTTSDAQLVIAGKNGWGSVRLPIDDTIHRIEDVDDRMVDRWMRHAACVLVPSFTEGFGRTALEAMARGVPVLVSDRGALPEVVGDGGIVLPLSDERAWLKAIVQCLEDPSERHALGERGRKRAADFTWHKTARIILAKIAEKC